MQTLYYVQGDTAPDINFTVKRSGTAVNLTGATVDFFMKKRSSGTLVNSGHTACTITGATTGECTYSIVSGDLSSEGYYDCDLQITHASGKIETSPVKTVIKARAQSG